MASGLGKLSRIQAPPGRDMVQIGRKLGQGWSRWSQDRICNSKVQNTQTETCSLEKATAGYLFKSISHNIAW